MECSLRYGRERFAQARALLEGRQSGPLRGYANTSNNRLRAAILAVYACVRGHFPDEAAYVLFRDLMFEMRMHDPDQRLLRATQHMSEHECVRFGRRLHDLARHVTATHLPSERFAAARRPSPGQSQRHG